MKDCVKCGGYFRQSPLSRTVKDECPICRRKPRRQKHEPNVNWTDDVIRAGLSAAINEDITPGEVSKRYCRLYAAVRRRFNSLDEACDFYGLPRLKRGNNDVEVHAGRVFEELVGILLNDLNLHHSRYRKHNLRPDFVVGEDWYDAKLSEWTINTCETVSRYEPHCSTLTIIFLRGRNETDRMLTEKTRLVHVDYFVNQLPLNRRIYYFTKLNEIKRNIDEKIS